MKRKKRPEGCPQEPSLRGRGAKRLALLIFCLFASFNPATAWPATSPTFQPFMPYPSYDSVILNPFDPADEGGLLLRLMQPYYHAATGRNFSIRDLPGRGGLSAWADIAGREDDGYTLALTDLPSLTMLSLQQPPPIGLDELTQVCLVAAMPLMLWVPEDSPFRDLYALVNHSFDHPESVIIAGTGKLTPQHLASLRFNRLAGMRALYAPYTGTQAAREATLSGRAQAFWGYPSPDRPRRAAPTGQEDRPDLPGQSARGCHPLAVAASERHPLFPQTPTFDELSYDLVEYSYFGLAISARTNAKTAQSVSAAFLNLARDSRFQSEIEKSGFIPAPLGAAELLEYLKKLREYYAARLADFPMQ